VTCGLGNNVCFCGCHADRIRDNVFDSEEIDNFQRRVETYGAFLYGPPYGCYVIVRLSVVCLSIACNIRAPYSAS